MILVSVGTQKFQFDRLLILMDELVGSGAIKEEVFAQIGFSTYEPKNFKFERFMDKGIFDDLLKKSDLLIVHSGVATIMQGVMNHKPIIVMPRLKKYGEHVDDHQLQITHAFAKLNLVLQCNDNDSLESLISKAKKHRFSAYHSHRAKVVSEIESFINSIKK